MNLRSTLTQLSCGCFSVLALLLPWSSFARLSHSGPNAPATSVQTAAQSKGAVSSGENQNANSSFGEAEGLRNGQRAESNARAIEKYKEAAEVWRAAGQFE